MIRVTDKRGQEKEEAPQTETSRSESPAHEAQDSEAGEIDFAQFVLSLSTSALMHMGLVKDPEGAEIPKNLPLANQEIAIIEMLQNKTKGNLSQQETKLVEEVLYELRVRFVQATKTP